MTVSAALRQNIEWASCLVAAAPGMPVRGLQVQCALGEGGQGRAWLIHRPHLPQMHHRSERASVFPLPPGLMSQGGGFRITCPVPTGSPTTARHG